MAAPTASGWDGIIGRSALDIGPLEGAGTTGWLYFAVCLIYPCSKISGTGRFAAILMLLSRLPLRPTGHSTKADAKAPGWRYCILANATEGDLATISILHAAIHCLCCRCAADRHARSTIDTACAEQFNASKRKRLLVEQRPCATQQKKVNREQSSISSFLTFRAIFLLRRVSIMSSHSRRRPFLSPRRVTLVLLFLLSASASRSASAWIFPASQRHQPHSRRTQLIIHNGLLEKDESLTASAGAGAPASSANPYKWSPTCCPSSRKTR